MMALHYRQLLASRNWREAKGFPSFFTRPDYIIIKCEENARNFSTERRNGKHDTHQVPGEMFIFNLFFIRKFSINASCFRLPLRRLRQARRHKDSLTAAQGLRGEICGLCQHSASSVKLHTPNWY